MSYLLDKKSNRNKFIKITLVVVILVILFFLRSGVFNKFSSLSEIIFRPVLVLGNSVGEKIHSAGAYFAFKNSLYDQNQKLQAEVDFNNSRNANYDSVVADNASLKEILGRKNTKANMILAAILSKPNQSLYDTLIIDAGQNLGVKVGNIVFAFGDVPIGRVDSVYDNSSRVVLFSNAGEKTQAIISGKNISMELVGRGGGNFEMILPKDLVLQNGDQVLLPGINPYVLAITQKIISDPRDPFNKALLSSPVNIQSLRFVEVEL